MTINGVFIYQGKMVSWTVQIAIFLSSAPAFTVSPLPKLQDFFVLARQRFGDALQRSHACMRATHSKGSSSAKPRVLAKRGKVAARQERARQCSPLTVQSRESVSSEGSVRNSTARQVPPSPPEHLESPLTHCPQQSEQERSATRNPPHTVSPFAPHHPLLTIPSSQLSTAV